MQNHQLETRPGPATQTRHPSLFIDDSRCFENAEDVDMQADALSAINAYKKAIDHLMAETYAAIAGDDFDVRVASAQVQALWVHTSSVTND